MEERKEPEAVETIRSTRVEDAAAVAELSGQLGYPTSAAEARGRLTAVLDSPEHAAYVAVDADDTVIGWVHVFVTVRLESQRFCELGGFVVREDRRGCGVGKQLLAAAERWAVETGVATLRVRSRTTRRDAHESYQRMGFSPSKTQEVFDKPLNTK